MVIDMMYRQDIEREGVEFYRYCFETVVFMNRVVE
jgi:hypothetical protein